MLLAEAVSIDPGVVVLILAVLLVLLLALVAVVVAGIVAGYRQGREPGRRGARAVWLVSLLVQGTILVLLAANGPELTMVPIALVTLVATLAAPAVGRRRR